MDLQYYCRYVDKYHLRSLRVVLTSMSLKTLASNRISEATLHISVDSDAETCFHRLIERSHLPFCPLLTVSSGSDCTDTYQKMLEQLKQVTEGRARAVRSLRPNLRSLFEAYEAEPDPDRRADMLTNAVVRFCSAAYVHRLQVSRRGL